VYGVKIQILLFVYSIELRQSAEGVDVLPDILGDGGGGGDGSSGNNSDADDGGPAGGNSSHCKLHYLN